MTVTETEEFTLEDFEFDIMCQTKRNRACPPQTPAQWAVELNCCGKIIFMCDLCLEKRLESNRHPGMTWTHEVCGASSQRWTDIFGRIEHL